MTIRPKGLFVYRLDTHQHQPNHQDQYAVVFHCGKVRHFTKLESHQANQQAELSTFFLLLFELYVVNHYPLLYVKCLDWKWDLVIELCLVFILRKF